MARRNWGVRSHLMTKLARSVSHQSSPKLIGSLPMQALIPLCQKQAGKGYHKKAETGCIRSLEENKRQLS